MDHTPPLNILLADDDIDDRFFFIKALKEIPLSTNLTTVHDGEELMHYLEKNQKSLPNILFLDLSMPRKTGFECLYDIKDNEKLKDIPVVMFSTSCPSNNNYEQGMIETLKKIGAQDYIRKPGDFALLKEAIHNILTKEIGKKLLNKQNGTL
jgi:CheY-like chemotaxis protein